MIKAVIFDVDGTLVDSVDLHAKSWQDAFAAFGHEVRLEDIRAQIGKGGDELMPEFIGQDELDDKGPEIEERRAEILKAHYLHQITAFPDVRSLFQKLIDDGKKIALASSAKKDELETYKQIAQIEDLVDEETSSDDAEKSKPHPDIFQAALKRLDGIATDAVLVVGDTPYDAEAAAKAGLRTIGLLCGGFSEESLRGAGCIAIYESPADLLAQYEKSPLARDAAK